MEVVKTEFEILRISEPVSLPFKGFDLVYHTLAAAGDPVIEVVGKSSAAGCKRPSHSLEGINPCVHDISQHQTGGLYIQEYFIFFRQQRIPWIVFRGFLIRNAAVSGNINRGENLHARFAERPSNVLE